MSKRYVGTPECERAVLGQRVAAGTGPARDLTHARILLKTDAGSDGPAWTDGSVAEALDAGVSTVERVRKRFMARQSLGHPTRAERRVCLADGSHPQRRRATGPAQAPQAQAKE